LNTPYKELEYLGIVHSLYNFTVDFAKHQVSLLVLEWIVESRLWAQLQAFYEGLNFMHLCIGDFEHSTTLERVWKFQVVFSRGPLSFDKIETLVGS